MPILTKTNSSQGKYLVEVRPFINYKYSDLDVENALAPPMAKGRNGIHILGTDQLGRDIAAGMIHGARVALIISISAIFLSFTIGVLIGLLIGYFGDNGIRKNGVQIFSLFSFTILWFYYFIDVLQFGLSVFNGSVLTMIILLAFILDRWAEKIPLRKYGLPLDLFVQRLFEIKESVPGLFIFLALISVFSQLSIFTIPLILALLFWMTFARQARAEALQIKGEHYIQSAIASGSGDFNLLFKHILPNAMPSLWVIIAFSFSSVILVESTLSFLGIGLPLEEVSWGKILAEARKFPKSWWLAVFPGVAIFLVLFAFNTLGDIAANAQRKVS